MKRSFFQAAVVSILLYGCTTWTLTKRLEKKLDGNYTRMLRSTLNRSWRQHPTRDQLYGHLPPITKTIEVRRTRHAGHCWRSRDEFISDVLQWTPTYGRAKAGRPARTYIHVRIRDVAQKTCQMQWMIGRSGERGQVYPCLWHDMMIMIWFQVFPTTRCMRYKFSDFFVWALLLIVHTWNSSPLRGNLLRLQCTCCTVPTTSGRTHGCPHVWACQWPSSQPLSAP